MVTYRKVSILALAILISGCNLLPDNFDNQEFGYLAELHVSASVTPSPCDEDELKEIHRLASILATYSEHTLNNNTTLIYSEIQSLAGELLVRESPSRTYCKMKRKSIRQVTDTALSVFGTRIKK